MKTYGLIGKNLSYSFSKKYFEDKFESEKIENSEYRNFSLSEIEEFPNIISSVKNLCGLNVTIPYKEKIIKYLDKIDKTAQEIGAVNTIKIFKNRNKTELHGFNTDFFGFAKSLEPHLNSDIRNALILGTGGASKAVAFVLKSLSIDYLFISRNPKSKNSISYDNLTKNIIENAKLIVNTTPLGMYPNLNNFPKIPYQYLGESHLLFDLIYNPSETLFLKFGKQNKTKILNGLNMLEIQAEKSWKIFHSA